MAGKRIASGLFGLALATAICAVFVYVSRFWTWRIWDKDGLFGLEWLRRDGDLLRRNLRELAKELGFGQINAFDVLIWAGLIFLALSILQWAWDKAARR